MLVCFVDECGPTSLEDTQRFLVLSSAVIDSEKMTKIEDEFTQVLKKHSLSQIQTIKAARRSRYDFPAFNKLSLSKKKAFWADVFDLCESNKVKFFSSIVDTLSLSRKYKEPDDPYERAYKHILERADLFSRKSKLSSIIVLDMTDKGKRLAEKHAKWKAYGTEQQGIEKVYKAPFFVHDDYTNLICLADGCCYSLWRLFEKGDNLIFDMIYSKLHYSHKRKLAIKIFPDCGTKVDVYNKDGCVLSRYDIPDEECWQIKYK